jgi:hypothetical protein
MSLDGRYFMLSRFAGVSEAGACRSNPESAKAGKGSLVQKEEAVCYEQTASIYVGDDLLSHTLSRAVQSALRGLTSVFGMGTGISPAVKSPASLTCTRYSRHSALSVIPRRTCYVDLGKNIRLEPGLKPRFRSGRRATLKHRSSTTPSRRSLTTE